MNAVNQTETLQLQSLRGSQATVPKKCLEMPHCQLDTKKCTKVSISQMRTLMNGVVIMCDR